MPIKSVMLKLLDPKRAWLKWEQDKMVVWFCFQSSSHHLVFRRWASKTVQRSKKLYLPDVSENRVLVILLHSKECCPAHVMNALQWIWQTSICPRTVKLWFRKESCEGEEIQSLRSLAQRRQQDAICSSQCYRALFRALLSDTCLIKVWDCCNCFAVEFKYLLC